MIQRNILALVIFLVSSCMSDGRLWSYDTEKYISLVFHQTQMFQSNTHLPIAICFCFFKLTALLVYNNYTELLASLS